MKLIAVVWAFYHKIKRALIYSDLILIVLTFYAGPALGTLRDRLLPAALAGAFAMVLESLFSIDDKLKNNRGVISYANVAQAVSDLTAIVKRRGHRKHTVQIIASSGGTTTSVILPALLDSNSPLEISMLIVDPLGELPHHFPKHWSEEVRATVTRINRIAARKDPNVSINCYSYDYTPCVSGILIDGQHLFLGFFVWVKAGDNVELSGAQQPHAYYPRTPAHEHLFYLFESWFDSAPRKSAIAGDGLTKKP
jgi:hypothetical protein